jgi:TnpA family transposase
LRYGRGQPLHCSWLIDRTLFTLDWLEDAELRRQTSQELNKGETRNSLARAVFIHRLGEIRDRTYENQQHRASGLNLLVTAIILWNTRYLDRAVAALRHAGRRIRTLGPALMNRSAWLTEPERPAGQTVAAGSA